MNLFICRFFTYIVYRLYLLYLLVNVYDSKVIIMLYCVQDFFYKRVYVLLCYQRLRLLITWSSMLIILIRVVAPQTPLLMSFTEMFHVFLMAILDSGARNTKLAWYCRQTLNSQFVKSSVNFHRVSIDRYAAFEIRSSRKTSFHKISFAR